MDPVSQLGQQGRGAYNSPTVPEASSARRSVFSPLNISYLLLLELKPLFALAGQ